MVKSSGLIIYQTRSLGYLPCKSFDIDHSFSRDSKYHTILENLCGLFLCLYKYFAEMFWPGTHKIEKWMRTAKFNVYKVCTGFEITIRTDQ